LDISRSKRSMAAAVIAACEMEAIQA
jgi:hypothetical protein